MSMLAERKRKQKWSLNPRGNLWSQDGNKFGQKMLEKMGWSKGKGLGAKLNGTTEHIRVQHKCDNTGVGFKDTEGWTEHESNFSALLQNLAADSKQASTENSDDEKTIKLTSLEKKSETSKKRVHYHKFTRGKDLSRYSEKDLANIFGKKSLEEVSKPKEKVTAEEEKAEEEAHDYGVQTHNGGSMLEYFSTKLKSLNKKNGNKDKKNDNINESESESEIRTGFGFGFGTPETTSSLGNTSFNTEVSDQQAHDGKRGDIPIKKKSKKRKISTCEEIREYESSKKLKKVDDSDEKGIINPSFDPLHGAMKVKKHTLTTITEDESEFYESFDGTFEYSKSTETFESIEGQDVSKRKKKNKKEKACEIWSCEDVNFSATGVDNPSLDLNDANVKEDNYLKIAKLEKKRRKKKKHGDECIKGIDNPCLESFPSNEQDVISTQELSVETESFGQIKGSKGKKSKKTGNTDRYGVDNSGFKENSISVSGIDILPPDASNCMETTEGDSKENIKIGKKQKKKKHKGNCNGIENPCLNLDLSNEVSSTGNSSLHEVKKDKKKRNVDVIGGETSVQYCEEESVGSNTEETICKKKKKRKNNDVGRENSACEDISVNGIDNPSFNLNGINEMTEVTFECEGKISKKEKKRKKESKGDSNGIDNPCLNLDTSSDIGDASLDSVGVKRRKKNKGCDVIPNNEPSKADVPDENDTDPTCDLMLNVCAIAVPEKKQESKRVQGKMTQRRRSVRFSSANEERIIPLDPNQPLITPSKQSHDNRNFDLNTNIIEENVNSMAQTIDQYQAEVENDLNEAKLQQIAVNEIMVGEVGDPHGDNELLPSGDTKLKLKHARFGKTPSWLTTKNSENFAKKSYKHLIKGDIVLEFKHTNLHEIEGYSINNLC